MEGNLAIIIAIVTDKKLMKNPAYILMMNLAMSDLGISIVVSTFTNMGIYF